MAAPATIAAPLPGRRFGWAGDALRVLAPFAAAILFGAIILWATGRDAIETYRLLVHYSLGDWTAIEQEIEEEPSRHSSITSYDAPSGPFGDG